MSRINLRYSLGEGIRGFFLNGFMTFAAVGIIASCLLITGSISLLALNIDAAAADQQKKSGITAYVDEKLSEEQAKQIGVEIKKIEYVNDAVFFSKEQELEEFRQRLGDNAEILDGIDEDNPLRHSYRISTKDINDNQKTVDMVKKIDGIADVRYNKDVSRDLINFRHMINVISAALIAMLGAVSVFIISNTVKIAAFARREEIAIMKMVGATDGFVRVPFIVEGILLGEVGAAIGFLLQWAFYEYIQEMVARSISFAEIIPFASVWPALAGITATAGIIIGAGGSVLAIRKFLKV